MLGAKKKKFSDLLAAAADILKETLAEAVDVEREILARGASPMNRKLSAKAFARDAVKKAPGATPEKRKAIEADPAQFGYVLKFIHEAENYVYQPGLSRMPWRDAKLRFISDDEDEARFIEELGILGIDRYAVFAIAAVIATETRPEVFGNIDDPEKWDARGAELVARRQELRAELAQLLAAPADFVVLVSGGAVHADSRNVCEELINHCTANPEILRALRNGNH